MIDETIDNITEKLTDIKDMMSTFICNQCNNRGTLYGCISCYNCSNFEVMERNGNERSD